MAHPIHRLFIPAPGQKLRQPQIAPECVSVSKASRREDMTEAEKIAAKLEPKLARAFFKLLATMQEAVDLQALADALASGDIGKVLSLIVNADTGMADEEVEQIIQEAVWGGAALAASQINARVTGAYFAFDRLNPRLISWLKGYSLSLIRQITDETKESIRDKLISGMTSGSNPVEVAREIKGAIGLTTRQQKAVSNFRKELQTFHERKGAKAWNLGGKIDRVNGRQVFKPGADGTPKDAVDERRLRDFRFDGQLQRAMGTGKPLSKEQIDRMVAAYERKYLRYRSEVIARTEALRTTNYGVQDAWRQAIETGKVVESQVRRMWIVAKDERLCSVCAPIPGMNPKRGVPFGKPFSTPRGPAMVPPIHPNCRCTLFLRQWEPEQLANG
jgi:hypothetical protein